MTNTFLVTWRLSAWRQTRDGSWCSITQLVRLTNFLTIFPGTLICMFKRMLRFSSLGHIGRNFVGKKGLSSMHEALFTQKSFSTFCWSMRQIHMNENAILRNNFTRNSRLHRFILKWLVFGHTISRSTGKCDHTFRQFWPLKLLKHSLFIAFKAPLSGKTHSEERLWPLCHILCCFLNVLQVFKILQIFEILKPCLEIFRSVLFHFVP